MGTADRRKRERDQRRGWILDAAREVFKDRGIEAATMDEVAERAELSKGALYLYFASKDDLLAALLIAPLDDLVGRFKAEQACASSGAELLERLLVHHVTSIATHMDLFRLAFARRCLRERSREAQCPARVRERRALLLEAYAAAVQRGRVDGSLRGTLDPSALAPQLWSSILGLAVLAVDDAETRRSLPAIGASLVDVTLRGVRTSPAAEVSAPDVVMASRPRRRAS